MIGAQKYIGYVVVCAVCVAVGRYSVPTKTKIVTQTVEVEKKTDDVKSQSALDKHKQTVQVSTKRPDGTVTMTTTTTEDDRARRSSDDKSTDNLAQTTTSVKEVTRSSSPVTIAMLVGTKLSFSAQPLSYGGFVYRPMIGPIGAGVWALSSGTAGVAVGLNF